MAKTSPEQTTEEMATMTEPQTLDLLVLRRNALLQALADEDDLHAENDLSERLRHNAEKDRLQGDLRKCRIALGEPLRPAKGEQPPAEAPADPQGEASALDEAPAEPEA